MFKNINFFMLKLSHMKFAPIRKVTYKLNKRKTQIAVPLATKGRFLSIFIM
jgi:hypothetical protein